MKEKRTLLRRIGRWGLWAAVILLVLFCLQVTVLAFPQMLLSNSVKSGTVTLFYRGTQCDEYVRYASEVEERLKASGFYDSSRTNDVFYFQSERLYSFFVRLTFLPSIPQGYNLSVFGNSFVSGPKMAALGQWTGGKPRYSIWDGDPSHIIAHEIGHQYMIDRLGRQSLPHWKQEGLPEYIANIGVVREDSLATLADRIAILNDDDAWIVMHRSDERGWDRIHYEAWLLVEFLLEVQGFTLDEIVSDSVTMEGAQAAMMTWYKEQACEENSL